MTSLTVGIIGCGRTNFGDGESRLGLPARRRISSPARRDTLGSI